MRKSRQLHLWIGLLTSVIILIEAITGLLLNEPWLMGVDKTAHRPRMEVEQPAVAELAETGETLTKERVAGHYQGGSNNSMIGFVKNLHAGRIGNTDVSILLDIMAIGLIILTITGITLSLRVLKTQRLRR